VTRRGPLLAAVVALLLLVAAAPAGAGDPRWRFYTDDTTAYTSPWFSGAHRIMVPFGCTRAPYYDPDPRCTQHRGFHHGLDVAMPCGTALKARIGAWVVSHDSLGPAYGVNPVLLRNHRRHLDIVIGHTRRVFVAPGDYIHAGEVFARAGDSGAPDGCHLHFEVRDLGGGLDSARWPRPLLALSPR
jgi:murein DD-endopeptidase MepM/ murein hydrolase activator NlpD